jgi:hypothetical protein
MKKYNASTGTDDILNVYGYSCAHTVVAVLKARGGDLARKNVRKQAAAFTSADDFALIKQMQLEKFNGTN